MWKEWLEADSNNEKKIRGVEPIKSLLFRELERTIRLTIWITPLYVYSLEYLFNFVGIVTTTITTRNALVTKWIY